MTNIEIEARAQLRREAELIDMQRSRLNYHNMLNHNVKMVNLYAHMQLQPSGASHKLDWKFNIDTSLSYDEKQELLNHMEGLGCTPEDMIIPEQPKPLWHRVLVNIWQATPFYSAYILLR